MSNYFSKVPNLDYVSRLKDNRSTNDYIEVKNLFLRAKVREDIFNNISFFEKYNIVGDDRPDNVAYEFYGDENLDWVVLMSNNIMNVYDEWPKSQDQLDKYLLSKYGSYDNLYNGIHHYETIEYKSTDKVTIVKPGLIVDELFYNAPQYLVEPNTNVVLPKPIPGKNATGTVTVSNTQILSVTINEVGTGYTIAPGVNFSNPDQVVTATAIANLSIIPGEREVGIITITNKGKGYTAQPTVTFSNPPPTVPPVVNAVIGIGGSVTSVGIQSGGAGYTFVPTVTFSTPENIVGNAAFLNQSSFTTGEGLEGMYVSADGSYLFTAHGDLGYTQGKIEQYSLSTPWDITSGTFVRSYTLTTGINFTYATGVEFKPDGRVMYVSGLTASGYRVASYNLSTAWNISTATFVTSVSVPAPSGIRLQDNGKFMFILDANNPDSIRKYSLSTAWNIATKSAVEVDVVNLFSLTGEDWFLGFSFSDDGTQLYAAGNTTDKAYVFNLTSPWTVSSATLVTQLNASTQDNAITDLYINSDKTRLFISGAQNRKVYNYNIDLTARGYAVIGSERIVQIVVTNPGGGYASPPTVTIQPPIPARTAVGYAVVNNGEVSEVVVTDPGYNYRSNPIIVFSSPPTPIKAEGYAKIFQGGIEQIVITEKGSGYTSQPSVSIGPPGNIYEPQVGEIYESKGTKWRFNGFNWYKKVTKGIIYRDNGLGIDVEIPGYDCSIPITNYEYELKIENKKRQIYLLKPRYLNIIFDDIEKLMSYKEGSEQYVSRTLKKGDNPRFYE